MGVHIHAQHIHYSSIEDEHTQAYSSYRACSTLARLRGKIQDFPKYEYEFPRKLLLIHPTFFLRKRCESNC